MAKGWAQGFYHSSLWRKQREYILKRDNYLCTEIGCHRVATEVHHIEELTEQNVNDPSISLNENNLRSLCHDCHSRITAEMKASQRSGINPEEIIGKIIFDEQGYPVRATKP